MRGEQLIFLISQPRAGSTLLQRIIQNHSMIYSLPEPWVMLHPLYNLKGKGLTAEYDSNCAYVAVKDFYSRLPEQENCYYEGLRRMYGYIYQQALRSTNKVFFLDKTPRYYHIIPELAYTFPEARFLILLRNPLSVLVSILNTWAKDDLSDLKNYKNDIFDAPYMLANGISSLKQKKLTIASYERILADPENELTKIFNSMNIPFERDVLELRQADALGYGYQDQTASSLSNRISSENIGSWRYALKNPQYWRLVADYLSILDEKVLEVLGYSHITLKNELQSFYPGRFALLRTYSMKYLLDNKISTKNRAVMLFEVFKENLKDTITLSQN